MVSSTGQAAVLGGDTWSEPEQIEHRWLSAVSCSGPAFCTAVDRSGYGITYRA